MNRSKENKLILCVFVNIIKPQQNKFKIATGHNDHYMINMGSQRPKFAVNDQPLFAVL